MTDTTLATNGLTRRQFFARMRKLGFSKAGLQMTRVGITYEKPATLTHGRISVTVPKGHIQTFHILGNVPFSGIYREDRPGGRPVHWGNRVNPADLGLNNMLEVCLGLCDGTIATNKER